MKVQSDYEARQIRAFSSLVDDGTYAEQFDHAPHAQEFFRQIMTLVLDELGEQYTNGISAIDCGCGNGAWLDYLSRMLPENGRNELFGFDLTPEMVAVARRRLESSVSPENLQAGSIIDPEAYRISAQAAKYQLIFTYDVIQQLPKRLQFLACETLLDNLRPGGIAVVFDNDCNSDFGKKMGRKKFLTKYLGLRLVPRYFCNAHYPPLEKFATALATRKGYTTETRLSSQGPKRALIIRSD